MRFAIIKGLPYLISGGKKYPVAIDGRTVKVGKTGTKTKEIGRYSLAEILAKLGPCSSIKEG